MKLEGKKRKKEETARGNAKQRKVKTSSKWPTWKRSTRSW